MRAFVRALEEAAELQAAIRIYEQTKDAGN